MRRFTKNGLSLVEVMIAIAIIAIIATVGTRVVRKYRVRARLTEAISVLGPIRQKIFKFYRKKRVLPDTNTCSDSNCLADLGLPINNPTPYITRIKYYHGSGKDGMVVVWMNNSALGFSGQWVLQYHYYLSHSGHIKFACVSGQSYPIPEDYLPPTCLKDLPAGMGNPNTYHG